MRFHQDRMNVFSLLWVALVLFTALAPAKSRADCGPPCWYSYCRGGNDKAAVLAEVVSFGPDTVVLEKRRAVPPESGAITVEAVPDRFELPLFNPRVEPGQLVLFGWNGESVVRTSVSPWRVNEAADSATCGADLRFHVALEDALDLISAVDCEAEGHDRMPGRCSEGCSSVPGSAGGLGGLGFVLALAAGVVRRGFRAPRARG